MNEIKLITREVTPAKVNFNYAELLEVAKGIKGQYKCLVFEEGTIKQAKETAAEIRKIQKNVNDFKVKTKKELTKKVKEFEEQCKRIIAEFDEPLKNITEQLDEFEQKRIESRKKQISAIIENEIENVELLDEFKSIEIDKKWFNKATTASQITAAVREQINAAIDKQEKRAMAVQLIQTQCEIATLKHSLNIPLSPYSFFNLIDINESLEISNAIESSAIAQAESEKAFVEKVQREKEMQANVKAAETIAKSVEQVSDFVPVEKNESAPILTTSFRIRGTREQFDAIKRYIKASGVEIL